MGEGALMRDRGGQPLAHAGYRCLGGSTVERENRLWGPDGRFKFVSYSNNP